MNMPIHPILPARHVWRRSFLCFLASLLCAASSTTALAQKPIIDNKSHNVHGSITEFQGRWYLFYHVEGPSQWERRVCVEPLVYGEDGTIKPVQMSGGVTSDVPASLER